MPGAVWNEGWTRDWLCLSDCDFTLMMGWKTHCNHNSQGSFSRSYDLTLIWKLIVFRSGRQCQVMSSWSIKVKKNFLNNNHHILYSIFLKQTHAVCKQQLCQPFDWDICWAKVFTKDIYLLQAHWFSELSAVWCLAGELMWWSQWQNRRIMVHWLHCNVQCKVAALPPKLDQ